MNLSAALAQYDKCQLECDGMTRVLHTVLTRLDQPHTVMVGTISLSGKTFYPHFWIVLSDGKTVDYRARMWLGRAAPHGIFKRSDAVYEGEPVNMEVLSDTLFKVLTS